MASFFMSLSKKNELMNLENRDSLARKGYSEIIKLSESGISYAEIPNRFKTNYFQIEEDLDLNIFYDHLRRIFKNHNLEEGVLGRLIPGVIEAVKNAHEHGNLKNPLKKVLLGRSVKGKKVEFLVGDQGGEIHGQFVPYVLLMREKGHNQDYSDAPDFYSFVGEPFAPVGHSGVGTKTMHIAFDDVRYFRRKNGGLLVHLKKDLS